MSIRLHTISITVKNLQQKTDPAWKAPVANNRMDLQFSCASEEVNKTYPKLVAAGNTSFKAPWDAFWEQRFAQIIDPDGNNIEIFAEL